jgi:predicted alpha/beta-fold hydrolase
LSARSVLAGHAYTVGYSVWAAWKSAVASRAAPLYVDVDDSKYGTVRLKTLFDAVPEADELLAIVHGFGGSAGSPYCAAAAASARAAGVSSVRVGLRGTDCSGEDLFHAGLTADLREVLRQPPFAAFRRVYLLGYSLGGHLALKAAAEKVDARLCAAAAISAPVNLDIASRAFDAPSQFMYRRYIFGALNKQYAAVAARGRAPTPLRQVIRARSSRARDALTVVPRFGFQSLEHYYAEASAAPLLRRLSIPTLYVGSEVDPLVPHGGLAADLSTASPLLSVRWPRRGGHVYFPSQLDLGERAPLGLEPQVLAWMRRR